MSVLDTNVSRTVFARHVAYRSPIWDDAWTDARSGYRYTCPRCAWKSPPMKWRYGAEHRGERHALTCASGGRQGSAGSGE